MHNSTLHLFRLGSAHNKRMTTCAVATVATVLASTYRDDDDNNDEDSISLSKRNPSLHSFCEAPDPSTSASTRRSDDAKPPRNTKESPPRTRFVLYRLGLVSTLPLPRPVDADRDPELQVSATLLRQRAHDERRIPQLQRSLAAAVRAGETDRARGLVTAVYGCLYGEDVTPRRRTEFLERYGCTAWNDVILDRLVDLAEGRGMVEIGAGHGQWARALDGHRARRWRSRKACDPNAVLPHPRTLVRAYDDGSHLPLDPAVYHRGTEPHRSHFGAVRPCPDVASVLAQFENRHRVLLLVYPTPDVALRALRSYPGDAVAYVGEGRGGANADEAFFRHLSRSDDDDDGGRWYLVDVLPGVPCGTKGDEKVFIFQKRTRA